MDMEKKFLSRDDIVAVEDGTFEDVWVEQWQGYVRIRSLTARERDRFESGLTRRVGKKEVKNLENVRAKLVALVATDDNNVMLFGGPDDLTLLGAKNADAVNTLFIKACELSGLSDEDVKDLEGKSETEDGTSSFSDSPEI